MVKELVRLHHGKIDVKSEVGKGSTFTVTLPTGKEHLPAEKIISDIQPAATSTYADAFVQEALKWLPDNEAPKELIQDVSVSSDHKSTFSERTKAKVLVADDNTDMRDYISRLLISHYEVITAVNGEDAFEKMRQHRPELMLSDIMMPKLDGFGLLNKVREHPDLRNTPVIFLSARAGEEAKIEGLESGADDYLVKPFSAKELLARVDVNIKIAKNRKAAENNLRSVIMQSPVATTLLRGPSFIIDIVNDAGLEVWGRSYEEVINHPIGKALPEVAEQGFVKLLEQVYQTGIAYKGNEVPVVLKRHGQPETVYLNFIYEPVKNEKNEVYGILGIGVDVTEQVTARKVIEQSQKELMEMANAMPQLVWVAANNGEVFYYNERLNEFTGVEKRPNGTWIWEGLLHPDDLEATMQAWNDAVSKSSVFQMEHRVQLKDGSYRWFLSRGLPHKNEDGTINKWFGTTTDIHASREQAVILEEEVKKRTKELQELNSSLQQSNNELQQFAHVASHDLKEPLRKIKTFLGRLADEMDRDLTERSKNYVSKIFSAVDRMNIMIEGVLNYSMLNAGEQKMGPVDLNEIVKQIESDLELLIAQKSAVIQAEKLPKIEGASVLLYQLFYNLINNSLKFSRADTPPQVNIGCSLIKKNNKDFVEIKVRDNGIGFEQEFADMIFETFLRLNSKDQFEGTGLGLSLCKRIAERHGGTIEAFGEPGNGALFVIYLPLAQQRKQV
jgi:PAS domain S-box-containing protein